MDNKEVYAAAKTSADPVDNPLTDGRDIPLSSTKLMVVWDRGESRGRDPSWTGAGPVVPIRSSTPGVPPVPKDSLSDPRPKFSVPGVRLNPSLPPDPGGAYQVAVDNATEVGGDDQDRTDTRGAAQLAGGVKLYIIGIE